MPARSARWPLAVEQLGVEAVEHGHAVDGEPGRSAQAGRRAGQCPGIEKRPYVADPYAEIMVREEPCVVWSLDGFSKQDELLRTQRAISREQIIKLREVITPDADDPWMTYCYEVPLDVWTAVEEILQCGPPDPCLDYQLSASAGD